MRFVKDRPGHGRRYAICSDKFDRELGILKQTPLTEGLTRTVDWYLANEDWWRSVVTGAYRDWIKLHYDVASCEPFNSIATLAIASTWNLDRQP